jgi:hypothetical protein
MPCGHTSKRVERHLHPPKLSRAAGLPPRLTNNTFAVMAILKKSIHKNELASTRQLTQHFALAALKITIRGSRQEQLGPSRWIAPSTPYIRQREA